MRSFLAVRREVFAQGDLADRALNESDLVGDRLLASARREHCENTIAKRWRHSRARMAGAPQSRRVFPRRMILAARPVRASLLVTVAIVVCQRPEKEMRRVAARRVVAAMTDAQTFRDRPIRELPGQPVGCVALLARTLYVEDSIGWPVPPPVRGASPRPALARAATFDLRPEALRNQIGVPRAAMVRRVRFGLRPAFRPAPPATRTANCLPGTTVLAPSAPLLDGNVSLRAPFIHSGRHTTSRVEHG